MGDSKDRIMTCVRGRVIAIGDGDGELTVHHEGGVTTVRAVGDVRVGDLVVVDLEEGRARVATPGRSADPGAAGRRLLDPRRLRGMRVREAVEDGVRAFFRGRGFREVRTPCLVESPGMEPHIEPLQVGDAGWLHTSPEFAMKRLLCGGLERIFQMTPVWREEPSSRAHRREFVMLEWYRAWAGEGEIQGDVEALVASLATAVHGAARIPWRGGAVDVSVPWPRWTCAELFRRHAGVDLIADDLRAACARHGQPALAEDTWDDLYFRLWLGVVEPALPLDRAFLVTRYPASQAALSVVDGPWARRFEAYAAGLELGNAFEELTDPAEQRTRFERDRRVPGPPLPQAFLAALEDGMPPSGGIAMGVDRLAMLLAGEEDIEYVRWL
jgi:lysyl-tRNA synthetase class 2